MLCALKSPWDVLGDEGVDPVHQRSEAHNVLENHDLCHMPKRAGRNVTKAHGVVFLSSAAPLPATAGSCCPGASSSGQDCCRGYKGTPPRSNQS